MESEKMAEILFDMTLDMDFMDNMELHDEAVSDLQREIEKLDKDSCLYRTLEIITTEMED